MADEGFSDNDVSVVRDNARQLKFKPETEVVEQLKDADVVLVNMVKFPESLTAKLPKMKAERLVPEPLVRLAGIWLVQRVR